MNIIDVKNQKIEIELLINKNGNVCWKGINHQISFLTPQKDTIENYIVEVEILGNTNPNNHSGRIINRSETEKLRYITHKVVENEYCKKLYVIQGNAEIEVESEFTIFNGINTITQQNTVKNISQKEICITCISGVCLTGIYGNIDYKKVEYITGYNTWFCECQFKTLSLDDLGIMQGNHVSTFFKHSFNNNGSWSSKDMLPLGIIQNENSCMMWTIEAGGSWHAEIGNYYGGIYFTAGSLDINNNAFYKNLKYGERLQSQNVTLSFGENLDGVVKEITKYRRIITRNLNDLDAMPLIFNEYMYLSGNNPNEEQTEKIGAEIAKMGAEYYCIDCGWHDEEEDCFNTIGKWQESKKRFPHGLKNCLQKLNEIGLKTGLWVEIEKVGIACSVVSDYADEEFFSIGGKKLIFANRYQLDFSNEKAYSRTYNQVSDIIKQYGIKYLKIDYNQDSGIGTDAASESLGSGLMQHIYAYRNWLIQLRKVFPDLVIENCASGGQRLDYFYLKQCDIQSVSDQSNYLKFSHISANMLAAVLPEQAGVWCYPNNQWADEVDEENIVMNFVNCFFGRMHLASNIIRLSAENKKIIKSGIDFFRALTPFRRRAFPIYPMGFSDWKDVNFCCGMEDEKEIYLNVWHMEGNKEYTVELTEKIDSAEIVFPLNHHTEMTYRNGKLFFKFEKDFVARTIKLKKFQRG